MAETVRVRCAVSTSEYGTCIYGDTDGDDSAIVAEADRWNAKSRIQFVTVEIPLPVEPVVVAEVEDGDE